MNKCIFIGNVCHSPEMRTTMAGKSVCRFEIAVNEKRCGEDKTEYIRVSAWNKLGEVCAEFLEKGRKVCVVGKIGARAYVGKDGEAKYQLELTAHEVEFLSAPQKSESQNPAEWELVNDVDLPF